MQTSSTGQPDDPGSLCELGSTLIQQGDYGGAIDCLHRALAGDPEHVEVLYLLGLVWQRRGVLRESVAWYQRALRLDPEHGLAYLQQGIAYLRMGEKHAAANCFRQSVFFRPDDAEAHFHLGVALNSLLEFEEAVASHRRALALAPDHSGAYSDLGLALMRQGKLDEAVECHRQSVALRPDWAGGHSNFGVTRVRRHETREAHECFERGLALDPENVFINFNRSNTFLLEGDYASGLALYDYHRKLYRHRWQERRWQGEDLAGRTILLYAQHGLGDTLQFVRYVPTVSARGGRVMLQVQDPLLPLFAGLEGVSGLRGLSEPPPLFDVQATLMELPAILGDTLETIPRRVPYLRADPALVRSWSERLRGDHGFKVGIVWQGHPGHQESLHRSCRLTDFAPLAAVPGVRLYSLQKGAGTEQLAASAFPLTDWSEELDAASGAFMDTAAILQSLDLMVSIDTSVCHLAGALARPTWLALPYWVDWRWLLDRNDSPWYPTLRLFRQPRPFDWAGVFEEMAAALRTYVPG